MEQHPTSWIVGGIGVVLALIAFAREYFKNRHDRSNILTDTMLKRIAALEARETEIRKSEDTMRTRITTVEGEAKDCGRKYDALDVQYNTLKKEYVALRDENQKLKGDANVLRKQNEALHQELQTLYKQIGIKRTIPPLPQKKK